MDSGILYGRGVSLDQGQEQRISDIIEYVRSFKDSPASYAICAQLSIDVKKSGITDRDLGELVRKLKDVGPRTIDFMHDKISADGGAERPR